MTLKLCRARSASNGNSDRGCKAAKITSAVLLAGLAASAAVAVLVTRRRRELPEPAPEPPRVDDPLR